MMTTMARMVAQEDDDDDVTAERAGAREGDDDFSGALDPPAGRLDLASGAAAIWEKSYEATPEKPAAKITLVAAVAVSTLPPPFLTLPSRRARACCHRS